ncbi:tyrosine-type recombinase/integrase [Oceanicella sp. SM1341]|uniref:tyrosine-type recombinase/integrase n=1 Tax=Oceanicella sp. SM1341 TaxID=1548889 RepID=UPI000E46F84F|nr:tyrosine-type recombinase/integrase [Oceanicella sp. SM1341]
MSEVAAAGALSLPVAGLPAEDAAALTELYIRGTAPNTLRAYERDLAYIAAWKQEAFGAALAWPESEAVALRFVLEHTGDAGPAAQAVAGALVARGLRRDTAPPSPATLDRRIATWRAFHRMRNLPSPFEAPLIAQARARGRRAQARRPQRRSANPITRPVLEAMLAACGPGLRGLRDRAVLMLGWASGGRRRSEISGLMREDVDISEFDAKGLVWLSLLETKTTGRGATPRLVLKGRAARAVVAWIDAAGVTGGPLFRPISKSGRVLERRLSPDGVRAILRLRLARAGFPPGFASAHGLRSGFLTQAALDGAPIQAAMRLSLHRSMAQAQRYYDDVDIAVNPATDLLDRPAKPAAAKRGDG